MKIMMSVCSLFQYFFIIIIYKSKKTLNINITQKGDTKRKLANSNNINDLINIYTSNDKIAYISTTKNENGDIFIMVNSEDSNSSTRFLYIINSDNTIENKTILINSDSLNIYPLITILKINNTEYLATVTQEGAQFEIIDFIQQYAYYCNFFKILSYNSMILRNTFINLNYYKNSDYILYVYVEKHNSNFLMQKLKYISPNITKFQILSTEKNVSPALTN